MATISDEYMRLMLSNARTYSAVILKATPRRYEPGADNIVWEHGRRNFELRASGDLAIVCPVTGEGEVRGICIFNTDVEQTKKIMNDDPAIKAGLFTYDVFPCSSFPGDSLP